MKYETPGNTLMDLHNTEGTSLPFSNTMLAFGYSIAPETVHDFVSTVSAQTCFAAAVVKEVVLYSLHLTM